MVRMANISARFPDQILGRDRTHGLHWHVRGIIPART